jgi:protein-tyrosine phosphatase
MSRGLFWIPGVEAGRLAVMPRPRGGDWLDSDIRSLRSAGADVLVSLLTDEEVGELGLADEPGSCARHGITFIRFPIADREIPSRDEAADELMKELAARVSGGSSVAVHCRMGIGRSALVAACVLGSLGDTADAAFDRISAARGYSVPDTDEQRQWVTQYLENHQTEAP